jgi:DNA-directed RNA polymerase specialized sigma24 family protein
MAHGPSTTPGGESDAPRPRRAGELTGPALDALLARLGPDRERAAAAYEGVRRRLVRLFEWRGWTDAEGLADETIDRVGRRLAEGLEIRAEDPYAYFAGVASLVLREVARRAERERVAARELPLMPTPPEQDPRLPCLDRCLDGLSPVNRELVLGYYASEEAVHVAARARLARSHGMEAGTLRVRVHRLRQGLEECVARCARETGGRNVSGQGDTTS